MRLLTHNMLVCNVKTCVETASRTPGVILNFPLRIELTSADGLKQVETDFRPELIAHMLPKIDWPALRKTASELGIAELPEAKPAKPEEDAAFLKSVHTLLMDIHVNEAVLVCPNCARRYPVKNGVPNMLLVEDEV